jgi:para-nitrobenzyl esterase
MMSYWANFAYTGSPDRGRDGREIEWTGWKNGAETNKRLLILDSRADGGIRMSSMRLTREGMRDRILNDASFADQTSHCQAYRQLFSGVEFRQGEYATLGKAGCID